MSEPVRRIKTPVRLEYTVTAGPPLSRFLAGLVAITRCIKASGYLGLARS